MVLSSRVIVGVARVSANACQYVACNPEVLNGDEVLDILFCFPIQQIRRLSVCLCAFFCFPDAAVSAGGDYRRGGGSIHPFLISSSDSSSSSVSSSTSSSFSTMVSAVEFAPAGSEYDSHSD